MGACTRARVTVSRGGEQVQLMLWHVERLLELDRRGLDLRGALFLQGEPHGKLADEVRTIFDGDSQLEVEVDVHDRYVDIKSGGKLKVRLSRPLRPQP